MPATLGIGRSPRTSQNAPSAAPQVGPFDKVWFCWESFPNLRKETKHSIWHTFWTGLMMREEVSQKVKDRFVTNLSHTQASLR